MPVGAYPGTFNPPTVAHLAVAEAAWRQGRLDRVELVVSEAPLGKSAAPLPGPALSDRLGVLEAIASTRSWLTVRTTELRLIAEIAAGYDAVILGADKWLQVLDPSWYGGSVDARDAAVGALPRILLAPRAGHPWEGPLPPGSVLLDVDESHAGVSSSAVRSGRREWMAPEALSLDEAIAVWGPPEPRPERGGD